MMSEWIKVKDRLPLDKDDPVNHPYNTIDVIVYNGTVFEGVFKVGDGGGGKRKTWGEFENWQVTHWMPLPNPPKR
jgi:hypothetical protein